MLHARGDIQTALQGFSLRTLLLRFLSSFFNRERYTPEYRDVLKTLGDVRDQSNGLHPGFITTSARDLMHQIDLYAIILDHDATPARYARMLTVCDAVRWILIRSWTI